MLEAARYEAEQEEAMTGVGIAIAFVRSVLWAAGFTVIGTVMGFGVGLSVTGWHGLLYVVGMVFSLFYSWRWIRGEDFEPVHLVAAAGLHVLILSVGTVISSRTYDLSEEGRSEHYEAIHLLREGWNPIRDGEVGLPVRGVRGPFSETAVFRSDGHELRGASILGAVLADFAGGTDSGKGYQWVFVAAGGVFVGASLLRFGAGILFSVLAGLAFGLGGPFVATWANFSPGADWVLLCPVLLIGLYGIREEGAVEWLDCVVAALLLGLFAGGGGPILLVGLVGLLILAGGLPIDGDRRRRVASWVWGAWVVGVLGLAGWMGAFEVVSPSEGSEVLAEPSADGLVLGEEGAWAAFTDPSEGLPENGSNGPLFVVGLGIGLFLVIRRFVVGLWPRWGTWRALIGMVAGLILIDDVEGRAVFWLGVVTVLLFDSLRDVSADELAPGFYRLGAPVFINLGRGGGTARWMAGAVLGLWILHGLVVGVIGTAAENRAQLEIRSFLNRPVWRAGIVRVGFGESVAAYEWMQRAQIRFELARNPGVAAAEIPWTDLRIFSLPEEDESRREVPR